VQSVCHSQLKSSPRVGRSPPRRTEPRGGRTLTGDDEALGWSATPPVRRDTISNRWPDAAARACSGWISARPPRYISPAAGSPWSTSRNRNTITHSWVTTGKRTRASCAGTRSGYRGLHRPHAHRHGCHRACSGRTRALGRHRHRLPRRSLRPSPDHPVRLTAIASSRIEHTALADARVRWLTALTRTHGQRPSPRAHAKSVPNRANSGGYQHGGIPRNRQDSAGSTAVLQLIIVWSRVRAPPGPPSRPRSVRPRTLVSRRLLGSLAVQRGRKACGERPTTVRLGDQGAQKTQ
jgi:hypothetical protein